MIIYQDEHIKISYDVLWIQARRRSYDEDIYDLIHDFLAANGFKEKVEGKNTYLDGIFNDMNIKLTHRANKKDKKTWKFRFYGQKETKPEKIKDTVKSFFTWCGEDMYDYLIFAEHGTELTLDMLGLPTELENILIESANNVREFYDVKYLTKIQAQNKIARDYKAYKNPEKHGEYFRQEGKSGTIKEDAEILIKVLKEAEREINERTLTNQYLIRLLNKQNNQIESQSIINENISNLNEGTTSQIDLLKTDLSHIESILAFYIQAQTQHLEQGSIIAGETSNAIQRLVETKSEITEIIQDLMIVIQQNNEILHKKIDKKIAISGTIPVSSPGPSTPIDITSINLEMEFKRLFPNTPERRTKLLIALLTAGSIMNHLVDALEITAPSIRNKLIKINENFPSLIKTTINDEGKPFYKFRD